MDRPVIPTTDSKRYRRHGLEFKVAIVQQTMQDGASVACIAREHGVNANQVFAWRKLYREGQLNAAPDTSPAMLPVTVVTPESRPSEASSHPNTAVAGVIRLECARGCLIIEGVSDGSILDRVLDRLLR
jgi:transposase